MRNLIKQLLICYVFFTAPAWANGDPAPATLDETRLEYQTWLEQNGQPPPKTQSASVKPQAAEVPTEVIHTQSEAVQELGPAPAVITPPMSFNENQQVMLDAAPGGPNQNPEKEAAFNNLLQENVPLTPKEVVRLRQQIDMQQRAAAIPANIPPKPVSSTLMVNLAPGTTPPAIRLAQGYITSLVFVDSTGSPWPIASFDIGDPNKLGPPQWDGKSNILLLQAVSPYGDSDLIVRLVGLPTPITLSLVFGQRVVDYRTDIHVSGIGPNAKELPTGLNLPNSANQLLLSVLDGLAPSGSKTLKAQGCSDCQVWMLGNKLYFRTRFTLLSPGWIGRMESPDGMIAYEVPRTSSLLVSQYGNPVELKVEGF
jgi:intracellular multiplication protein IcmK